MKILIGFTGTVVTHTTKDINFDIGAVPILKRLTDQGHELILTIHALNELHAEAVVAARVWFLEKDIPLLTWTDGNSEADLIIHDAALGCPLTMNPEMSDRPFVNWFVVESMLEKTGVLKAETVAETIREMNEEFNSEQTNQ